MECALNMYEIYEYETWGHMILYFRRNIQMMAWRFESSGVHKKISETLDICSEITYIRYIKKISIFYRKNALI
jgi:hypothetical protein